MKVAVILPAFNEEVTIEQTIIAFHNALPEANIYVIDNNSSDKTGYIAKNILASLNNAGKVIFEPRQGKGNAVKTAFNRIDADVYVLCDADLTYPADEVGNLINTLTSNNADMVVGNRQSEGCYQRENKRSFHLVGNKLVNYLVNKLFSASLSDIMSGYRVFSKRFVKNYPILVEGFEIETDVTLYALHHQFKIIEVGIKYKDRPEGSYSKLNTLSDGKRVIFTLLQIFRFYKPLVFFGTFSLVLALCCLIAGYFPVEEFIAYRYITHVPLAILACGLGILAVIFLNIGLILDAMRRQEDMQFQLHLLRQGNYAF